MLSYLRLNPTILLKFKHSNWIEPRSVLQSGTPLTPFAITVLHTIVYLLVWALILLSAHFWLLCFSPKSISSAILGAALLTWFTMSVLGFCWFLSLLCWVPYVFWRFDSSELLVFSADGEWFNWGCYNFECIFLGLISEILVLQIYGGWFLL